MTKFIIKLKPESKYIFKGKNYIKNIYIKSILSLLN